MLFFYKDDVEFKTEQIKNAEKKKMENQIYYYNEQELQT